MLLRLITIFIITLSLSSCKVNFNFTGGGGVDPNLKTISIETFSNEAPLVVSYLSQEFTEGLRDYFLSQSRLSITDGAADIEVSGRIIDYSIVPLAIQGNETAAQNKLTIRMKVKFNNNVNESDSWEKNFQSYTTYNSDVDLASVERELIETVSEQIIQNIFNESLGKW